MKQNCPEKDLHLIYIRETGLSIAYSMQRHYAWEAFRTRGFTDDDLTLVCRTLRKRVKKGFRQIASLSFRFLVEDLDSFEELLAECRALQRRPTPMHVNKADVLRATGRSAEPTLPEPVSAATALERTDLAQRLNQFKKKL